MEDIIDIQTTEFGIDSDVRIGEQYKLITEDQSKSMAYQIVNKLQAKNSDIPRSRLRIIKKNGVYAFMNPFKDLNILTDTNMKEDKESMYDTDHLDKDQSTSTTNLQDELNWNKNITTYGTQNNLFSFTEKFKNTTRRFGQGDERKEAKKNDKKPIWR